MAAADGGEGLGRVRVPARARCTGAPRGERRRPSLYGPNGRSTHWRGSLRRRMRPQSRGGRRHSWSGQPY
eukprot:scaffold326086_cov61-Tisochrysis_lutea.AAC.2